MLEDEDPRVSHATCLAFCFSEHRSDRLLIWFSVFVIHRWGLILTHADAGNVLMPSQELV